MITGAHAILYSSEPDQLRALLRDVFGFPSQDIGGGWLVFALPPAELAVHPAEVGGTHELYFTCDDINAAVAELKAKGVTVADSIIEQSWGFETSLMLPGDVKVGLYEPRRPT
jgi:hypothetical protein